jgi:CDP-diacylglycerol---glycerol-3-phosphate 3-phosphatidyltransferase
MHEAADHLERKNGGAALDGDAALNGGAPDDREALDGPGGSVPTQSPQPPAIQQFTDGLVEKTWLRLFPRSVRPNQVTVARFILIPVVLALLYFDHRWWALGVFVIAVCTDFIDGAMARTRNQITQLGTYMDPIADKLLIGAVLAWVGWEYLVVKIIVVFILIELVASAVGVSFYVRTGQTRGANYIGKVKMVVQSVALLLFLIAGFLELDGLETVSVYLLWLALALAVLSGAKQILTGIKNRPRGGQGPAVIEIDRQRE